jgi:choline dehydrogenase-like flavoprotein
VTKISGLAAETDALAELFPLHCDQPRPLPASRQAENFLKHLGKHRTQLNQCGWHFGRARLAVRAADNARGKGCVCCGLCLSGCPYDCIYNSASTVRQLRAEKNFTYQGDVIVTRLREDAGGVQIEARHRLTGAPLTFTAGRVYLAAGVIPTAQLVLRSQSAYDQTLTLRDSQYFLLPLLMARGAHGVEAEALYTLSQAFLEIADHRISRRSIHLQIYGYSDWVGQAIRHSLGPLKFLARPLVERMLIVQGFLHSDESPVIGMTLRRAENSVGDCLQLVPQPKPEARRTVNRLQRALLRHARQLGGLVLPPMLQMAQPGRSFHSGGSLPMRAKPAALESDMLGRPHGWSRIHAVDASVLPSVPATTITFTVMANAHRIGWETAEV